MHARRFWQSMLFVIAATILIGQQILTKTVVVQAQETLQFPYPSITAATWEGYTKTNFESVFPDGMAACESFKTLFNTPTTVEGTELEYFVDDSRKGEVYQNKCYLKSLINDEYYNYEYASRVSCPIIPLNYPQQYIYNGGTDGVCILSPPYETENNNIPKQVKIFRGGLNPTTKTVTVIAPTGDGQTTDVKVQVNENGDLVDPLTGKVTPSIDPSKVKNTLGSQTLEKIFESVKDEVSSLVGKSTEEKLNFVLEAIDKYGNIPDVADLIESRLKGVAAVGAIGKLTVGDASANSLAIASGFITGDFPSYLNELDGVGVKALFDKVNNAFPKIENKL